MRRNKHRKIRGDYCADGHMLGGAARDFRAAAVPLYQLQVLR